MAGTTQYFVVEYDNEASGPFAEEGALLTWSGGTGFIVTVIDNGTVGKLQCALVSGVIPTNNQQLTQGSTTADTNGPASNGNSELMLYPAYFRKDVAVAQNGATTWSGPALGATHSFFFDGQTTNVVAGEILTFVDGQKCEVVTVESDTGAAGELSVRWITFIDTFRFPDDNDTFTGNLGGNGTLNGLVHERAYTPLHLHRLYSDLNDDRIPAGDDFLAVYDPDASVKDTDQIVRLLNVSINDTVAQHMYGGSISQSNGLTLYSGWNVQIVDPDGETAPVLIQNDAIITDYWENSYNPDSIAGRVRIMIKTRSDGVDIDGKRVKGKLLRYGFAYFEGSTTLGTATTALTLFTSVDTNNQTASGTVAGAPYNTIILTDGYATIDFNNGNGATPYAMSFDLGSATKAQAYERWKYIQRQGTSESLFGRNAQLVTGVTLNFAYDGETGGPFQENEIVAWGTQLPYTGESGGPFTVGEVVLGGTSGARGRIIYLDDQGTTGTIIVAQDAGTTAFSNTETITGQSSSATATTGTVVTNANFGRALLMALNDTGTAGNLYLQSLIGLVPADNQRIFGATSLARCDVNGTPETRVINNQYVGVFTGSDFQTNFGIALDPSDATAGDRLTNLLGVQQAPPNNQQGQVTGGFAGDYLTVYPWDGSSFDVNGFAQPDFNEATLTTALVAGVSTTVVVTSIPANTPAAGFLRIERDSDSELDLLQYVSWSGSTYTLGGATPTAPSAAGIGNDVMRALIDKVWATTGVPEAYTAVQVSTNQVTITLKRGGVNPIKPSHGTATFGTAGFTAAVQRISDA